MFDMTVSTYFFDRRINLLAFTKHLKVKWLEKKNIFAQTKHQLIPYWYIITFALIFASHCWHDKLQMILSFMGANMDSIFGSFLQRNTPAIRLFVYQKKVDTTWRGNVSFLHQRSILGTIKRNHFSLSYKNIFLMTYIC